MIEAGDLDEQIQLYTRTLSDDGYQTVETFGPSGDPIWAKFMPGRVREIFENGGREGELPAVFKVRRYPATEAIDATYQLVHRGDTYDVQGARREDRDAMLIWAVASDDPVVS